MVRVRGRGRVRVRARWTTNPSGAQARGRGRGRNRGRVDHFGASYRHVSSDPGIELYDSWLRLSVGTDKPNVRKRIIMLGLESGSGLSVLSYPRDIMGCCVHGSIDEEEGEEWCLCCGGKGGRAAC